MDSSHPDLRVMVPHCGFDLHFSDNEWCWASFHVFLSHLYFLFLTLSYLIALVFLGSSAGKESACNAGDWGSVPGLERSAGGGHGNLLQYSCLGNHHGQRSLVGDSSWGHRVRQDWVTKHSTEVWNGLSYSWSPNNELSQGWGCSEGWNPRLRSTGSVLPLRALWCLNDLPEDDTFINFFKKLFYSPQAIPRWHPLHSPCLENPMDRGAWRAAGLQRVGYTWSDLTLTHAPKRSRTLQNAHDSSSLCHKTYKRHSHQKLEPAKSSHIASLISPEWICVRLPEGALQEGKLTFSSWVSFIFSI